MTTKNQSAFLMCPTNRTTHLGGTPLESGEAGGHIRKESWISAFDAALAGLHPLIRSDQALVGVGEGVHLDGFGKHLRQASVAVDVVKGDNQASTPCNFD